VPGAVRGPLHTRPGRPRRRPRPPGGAGSAGPVLIRTPHRRPPRRSVHSSGPRPRRGSPGSARPRLLGLAAVHLTGIRRPRRPLSGDGSEPACLVGVGLRRSRSAASARGGGSSEAPGAASRRAPRAAQGVPPRGATPCVGRSGVPPLLLVPATERAATALDGLPARVSGLGRREDDAAVCARLRPPRRGARASESGPRRRGSPRRRRARTGGCPRRRSGRGRR